MSQILTFNTYQQEARKTAIYPAEHCRTYPALGLAGEAGEVCEKVKKILRDDNGQLTQAKQQDLKKELGDVLWYVANLAGDLDLEMGEIAQLNLEKLKSRQERGVLKGSGDNR